MILNKYKGLKVFSTIIGLVFIFNCGGSESVKNRKKCRKLYHGNYTNINNQEYKTIFKEDTITYSEVRFECVISALMTHKVMYDNYGMWDEVVYPNNKKHPLLFWDKVDIFKDGNKYNIFTNGDEGSDNPKIYASFMVFNELNQDLLKSNSKEKEKLMKYFSDLIGNNDKEKRGFYEIYWQMVDPSHLKMIKALRQITPKK